MNQKTAHRWALGATALAGRVLIAEDNRTSRAVVENLLHKLGVDCEAVVDGRQAVDAATTRDARPQLLLMDVQMPVMDGLMATELIRRWEAENGHPRLPIVALTARAFDEDRRQCQAAGMDDFLTKPIDMDQLAVLLARWMNSLEDRPHKGTLIDS